MWEPEQTWRPYTICIQFLSSFRSIIEKSTNLIRAIRAVSATVEVHNKQLCVLWVTLGGGLSLDSHVSETVIFTYSTSVRRSRMRSPTRSRTYRLLQFTRLAGVGDENLDKLHSTWKIVQLASYVTSVDANIWHVNFWPYFTGFYRAN